MPTAEVTLTTSLQDISALGRGRQYCWAGASSDFQATIEAADATNATTAVTIAVCAQSSGVAMLPGDASFAAKFTLVSGSLGAIWVQGPDTGSLVLDLSTSFQDVSSLSAGREVFLAGATPGLVVAIEIARSTGSTDFVEVARLTTRQTSALLPADSSVAMRYRVAGGVAGPNTKVWICSGVGGSGAAGPAGGDLAGTYPDPTVVGLTGTAGIVDLKSGSKIQQTQAAAITDVIGTADITNGALYGVGGTLDGLTLRLNIDQQGLSPLALNGAGNTATKTAFLSAIAAKVAWLGVAAVQGGPGGNELVLTAPISILVDAASTSLAALGLVAGFYSFTVDQEIPLEIVPQSGQQPWRVILSSAPGQLPHEIDDTIGLGYNVFNEDPAAPGAGWVIEQFFNNNFEFYAQLHTAGFGNPLRPFSLVFDKDTGVNGLRIGSQNVSFGFVNGSGGVGNDTQQINFFAAAYDRQTATGVAIDLVTVLSSTVALIDAGATLTNYAIRANVSGQIINLQANVNGSLRIDSTNLGFFAGNGVGKQTVTGSKGGNAALSSLMTALGASGYNLVTDSTS